MLDHCLRIKYMYAFQAPSSSKKIYFFEIFFNKHFHLAFNITRHALYFSFPFQSTQAKIIKTRQWNSSFHKYTVFLHGTASQTAC